MAAIRKPLQEGQSSQRAAKTPRRWLILSALLVLAVLAAILILPGFLRSPVEQGMVALVEAFRKQRLIEPRLSGGFLAGEFKSPVEDASLNDNVHLNKASELIRDALATGDSTAELPYARLLLSQNEKLPEALKYLRRVVAATPESADAHNDLGVCFIQQDKLEDAIDEFDVALNHRPDMPEALFNRALCYRRLLLSDAADADLARLIETEREKSWQTEASRRRQELSATTSARSSAEIVADLKDALESDANRAREIVDRNYAVVRRYFFFKLAQRFLRPSVTIGQETFKLARTRMEKISQIAIDVKGDRDMADTAKKLIATPQQDRAGELQLLSNYKVGLDLYQQQKYDDARAALEELHLAFKAKGDSLFQAKTKYAIAQTLYHSRALVASLKVLDEILPLFEARGWRYHQAQTLNLIGLNYSRLGQDSKAFTYFIRSHELFKKMSESVAMPLQYVGMAYWHLGNFEKSLENFRVSTSLLLQQAPSPYRDLAYNYLNVADVYRLIDRSRIAMLFAAEALKYSTKAKDLNRSSQVSSFEAVEYARAGETQLAAAKIDQAFKDLGGTDAATRAYSQPLLLIRAGQVALLRGDSDSALQYYTKAEDLNANAEGDPILHINALRGRAEAYVKAKQTDLARKDLNKAISIIEGYRSNLIGRVHRMEFLSASQSAFDQMILLEAEQPEREARAFEMSERSRARALLDDYAPSGDDAKFLSKPITLDRIKSQLPENLALLVYSVTDEQTFIFVVTHSGCRAVRSPVNARQLERLVTEYVSNVKTPQSDFDGLSEQGRELYRLLISPVQEWLPDGVDVCIVPDKSLQLLPMAALKDPADRYLIESHNLIVAPSATVFVRCLTEGNKQVDGNKERLLAVGNPKFASKLKLRDLADARREAEGASAYYDRPLVLTEADASEARVRDELTKCNVAHFAAHCFVDPQSPWLSALLLGPGSRSQDGEKKPAGDPPSGSSGDTFDPQQFGFMVRQPENNPQDGLLYLNEIYNLKLPVTRMVVLSACETALGRYYRGEGVVSLIHPFLAARVSTVVASLWPVDSQATSALMIQFHKERTVNSRAGVALRAAQLKMIADYPHPYYWASFIVVGSDLLNSLPHSRTKQ